MHTAALAWFVILHSHPLGFKQYLGQGAQPAGRSRCKNQQNISCYIFCDSVEVGESRKKTDTLISVFNGLLLGMHNHKILAMHDKHLFLIYMPGIQWIQSVPD